MPLLRYMIKDTDPVGIKLVTDRGNPCSRFTMDIRLILNAYSSLPRSFVGVSLLAGALSGCATLTELSDLLQAPTLTSPTYPTQPTTFTTEPTQSPSTPTPTPFTELTPALIIESLQNQPTSTTTPLAIALPPAKIQVFRPGPGSQVTSPFRVSGWAGPSFNERVWIKLIGEDGRLISQRLTYLMAYPDTSGRFSIELPFDTPYVAEAARLEISTQGLRYPQMEQLTTVDLVLLTSGSPKEHAAIQGAEQLTIFSPRDNQIIQGGTLTLSGAGWTETGNPLQVELIDRAGNLLSADEVELTSSRPGELGTFEIMLSYEVTHSQYARIGIFERSDGIPGILHYSSVEIWLVP